MPKPPNAQRLLEVQDVRMAYGLEGKGPLVLDGVNVTIDEGEIVALLGRSGSGKSSLLRIIAGLLKPINGRALWQGAPVNGPGRGLPAGVRCADAPCAIFATNCVRVAKRIGKTSRIHSFSGRAARRLPVVKYYLSLLMIVLARITAGIDT